jgi:hypothetical protein
VVGVALEVDAPDVVASSVIGKIATAIPVIRFKLTLVTEGSFIYTIY